MATTDNPASRELGYCPCCGYRTLPEGAPGSLDRCPVCHWVDDAEQFSDPDHLGQENEVTLSQARTNFEEHGACLEGVVEETRTPSEPRDPNWPYQE